MMILKIQWPLAGEGKCLIYDERRLVHHQADRSHFDAVKFEGGITLSDYLMTFSKIYVEGHVDDNGLLHITDFVDENPDW